MRSRFCRNEEAAPTAFGHFVHVYVERSSNGPVPIPVPVRSVLEIIRSETPTT